MPFSLLFFNYIILQFFEHNLLICNLLLMYVFLSPCFLHESHDYFQYKFQHVRFHWSHYSRSNLPAAYSPMKLLFHSFSGKWNCVEDSIQNAGKSSLWTQSNQHLLTSFTTPFVRSSLKLECVINYLLAFCKCWSTGTSIVCNSTACCSCWFLCG